MEKELFVVTLYDCVKGICTEDNKTKIISEIANSEFDGDISEARDYVEFEQFKLNELKF